MKGTTMNERDAIEETGASEQDTLTTLKAEFGTITGRMRDLFRDRTENDDTRLCAWDGQSPDGLKHADALGEEPLPFEGATDSRVRLADMLVNDKVVLLCLAIARAKVRVVGIGPEDQKRAARMAQVLSWFIRNRLGYRWLREWTLLANWYLGDTPAHAVMRVEWVREERVFLERVKTDQLLARYGEQVLLAGVVSDADAVAEAVRLFAGMLRTGGPVEPERLALVAETIQRAWPDLKPARARKAARQLLADGECEFPVRAIGRDEPLIRAARGLRDVYMPWNTMDWDNCRAWFEPRWMTRVQVEAAVQTEGWRKEFADEVLKHEALPAVPEFEMVTGGSVIQKTTESYRGLYQVVDAHFLSVNEDGLVGRYRATFHPAVDMLAREQRLEAGAHGAWPGMMFVREWRDSWAMESRGVVELAAPMQGMMKLFLDTFGDHAQIAGVPPVVTQGRERDGRLRLTALAEIRLKANGKAAYLQPPQYPAVIEKMLDTVKTLTDQYFGRANASVDPGLTRAQQAWEISWWLIQVREVLAQIMALIQEHATDTWLAQVTNGKGEQLVSSRDEIAGAFNLDLQYDERVMDPEYVKNLGQILKDVLLPLDRDRTVRTQPIVEQLTWWLFPEVAEQALQPREQAIMDEVSDEMDQYLKIRGGEEPELPEDGSVDYATRAKWYEDLGARNPMFADDMGDDKREILASRLERLATLAGQYGENAQIGREGGRRALPAGVGSVA